MTAYRGESGIPAQHAEAKPRILHRRFDKAQATRLPALLLGSLGCRRTRFARARKRVSARHAACAPNPRLVPRRGKRSSSSISLSTRETAAALARNQDRKPIQQPSYFSLAGVRKLPVIIAVLTRISALPSDQLASPGVLGKEASRPSATPPSNKEETPKKRKTHPANSIRKSIAARRRETTCGCHDPNQPSQRGNGAGEPFVGDQLEDLGSTRT